MELQIDFQEKVVELQPSFSTLSSALTGAYMLFAWLISRQILCISYLKQIPYA